MNLYMTSQLAELERHIDDDGVVDIDSFNRCQLALQEKQLAVVAYLKNSDANIEMLDGAIKELTARKKAMQSRYDGLKDYLLVNMQAHSISEISDPAMRFTAKIKKNPHKLVIENEELIPRSYFVQLPPPPPSIDNARLKDDLKAGMVIDGATLVQNERVDIK